MALNLASIIAFAESKDRAPRGSKKSADKPKSARELWLDDLRSRIQPILDELLSYDKPLPGWAPFDGIDGESESIKVVSATVNGMDVPSMLENGWDLSEDGETLTHMTEPWPSIKRGDGVQSARSGLQAIFDEMIDEIPENERDARLVFYRPATDGNHDMLARYRDMHKDPANPDRENGDKLIEKRHSTLVSRAKVQVKSEIPEGFSLDDTFVADAAKRMVDGCESVKDAILHAGIRDLVDQWSTQLALDQTEARESEERANAEYKELTEEVPAMADAAD